MTVVYESPTVVITQDGISGNRANAFIADMTAGAVATAADRVQTGLDRAVTAADRVQTGLDRAVTAADRVQTGLDRSASAASAAQAALYDGVRVDAFADLATLTPSDMAVGKYVQVRSLNQWYRRVSTGGHLDYSGAGGVKLGALPIDGGDYVAQAFGVIADGVADDTLALIKGWAAARAAGVFLRISGNPRLVAASVPVGSIIDRGGKNYTLVSNMQGAENCTLTIVGAIRCDTTGLDQTRMMGFRVVTDQYFGESSDPSSFGFLFQSFSGTKTLAEYERVSLTCATPDTTGATRGDWFLRELGAASVRLTNVAANNAVGCYVLDSCTDVVVRDPTGINIQTTGYMIDCNGWQVTGTRHRNTQGQADHWVGRTYTSPRSFNGFDGLLTENCPNGWMDDSEVIWAHERGCYLQGDNTRCTRGRAINCDGWKVVGTAYASPIAAPYMSDCHVTLTPSWVATLGRGNINLGIFYWANGAIAEDCTATNKSAYPTAIPALFAVGRQDGSTVDGLTIRRCRGDASRLVMGFISSQTTAQLAALSPAGSFVSLKNMLTEGCWLTRPNFAVYGGLFDWYSTGASADALATYAGESFVIRKNALTEDSNAAGRADWLYDFRYVNVLVGEDNTVNLPLRNGGVPTAAVTQPHAGVLIRERGLSFDAELGTLLGRLTNINLAAGSEIILRREISGRSQIATARAAVAGPANKRQAQITGTGYQSITSALDFGIEMRANGTVYVGKRVGATRTDQLSTPQIVLTLASGDIQVRGELAPTVVYDLLLTVA